MKEGTYKDQIFFFDVIKLNQLIDLDFNTKDLYQNLSPLMSKQPDLSKPEFIGGRYIMGKSGEGKLSLRLDGYRLTRQRKLAGNPLYVTFVLYNTELSSATEAGPLHFGYGKESYVYKYDPGKGFNSDNYAQLNWWAKFKSRFGLKLNIWKDSDWVARSSNSRLGLFEGNPAVFYDMEDRRAGKEGLRWGAFDVVGGWLYGEGYEENTSPFLKPFLKRDKVLTYDSKFPFYPKPAYSKHGNKEVEMFNEPKLIPVEEGDTRYSILSQTVNRKNPYFGYWEKENRYFDISTGESHEPP